MPTYLFKKIARLIRKDSTALPAQPAQNLTPLEILSSSGKFNSQWYGEKYRDVAQDPRWANNLALHYLLVGGFEGRKPTPWFDSAWYLLTYTDVKASQMNPLLHYIMHGSKEGRHPNQKKQQEAAERTASKLQAKALKKVKNEALPTTDKLKTADKKVSNGKAPKIENVETIPAVQKNQRTHTAVTSDNYLKDVLVKNLWGGYPSASLKMLEKMYNDVKTSAEHRFSACMHAVRWYFFVEDYHKVLELAALAERIDAKFANRKFFVSATVSTLCKLKKFSEASKIAERYLATTEDPDVRLLLANTLQSTVEKLSQINKVFNAAELSPIELKDPQKPLNMDNIVSHAPVIQSNLKVSVILPVYNCGRLLPIAINSLQNQSWRNLEIIIVDDCSPDNTFEIAQQLAAQDSRIIAIKQTQNAGAYSARNTGLQFATGDFITTHDGDDWSHPQKIQMQLEFLQQHPQVMGVCTHWIRALSDLEFTQNWRLESQLIHWSHSSFLFKRQIIEDIGPWDRVLVGGDTEFIWRIQAKYGQHAVEKIHKKVPFSFALDDDSSLTRAKATHVRTIHNGLRHIYRSTAKWWHRSTDPKNLCITGVKRAFPAPATMLERENKPLLLDLLIIGDFSNLDPDEQLLQINKDPNKSIGVFHCPAFGKKSGELSDIYFELIQQDNIQPIVYGQSVEAQRVVFLTLDYLNEPPEEYPNILSSLVTYKVGERETEIEHPQPLIRPMTASS
jgi:hypothetical protein